jgi:ferredoxin
MCEFCIKHGEGKKWYLRMENYCLELLSEKKRERFFTQHIIEDFEQETSKALVRIDRINYYLPFLAKFVKIRATNSQKKAHFGQIVPIEEAIKILSLANSITRFPCVCRRATRGKMEERYCIGVGVDPRGKARDYPDFSSNLEVLEKEAAIKLIEDFDQQGLVHSIWTIIPPYVGTICNCVNRDCLAFKAQFQAGIKIMFKSEYICKIDGEKCNGCRRCVSVCQFGAISYSSSLQRCSINLEKCYGCGVCRAFCSKEAITILERKEIPLLRNN